MSNPKSPLGDDSYTVAIPSAQGDFSGVRSRLQEIVEGAGYIFLLYPKSYWGRYKRFTRKRRIYTLAGTVTPHWLMEFMLTADIRTAGDCSSGSWISRRATDLQIFWSAHSVYSGLTGRMRCLAMGNRNRCIKAAVGYEIEHTTLLSLLSSGHHGMCF